MWTVYKETQREQEYQEEKETEDEEEEGTLFWFWWWWWSYDPAMPYSTIPSISNALPFYFHSISLLPFHKIHTFLPDFSYIL